MENFNSQFSFCTELSDIQMDAAFSTLADGSEEKVRLCSFYCEVISRGEELMTSSELLFVHNYREVFVSTNEGLIHAQTFVHLTSILN